MKIIDQSVYVGPSLYAHFPVIRLGVDLGPLEEWPSGKLGAAFTSPLIAALPGLHEHGCSYGEPGGFIRRLTEDDGTWMGHILEHVAIELQNIAGEAVTFGKTRSNDVPGHYDVIYQYEQEDVGLEAGRLGITLLLSLLPPELRPAGAVPPDFDFAGERDEFIRFAQRRALGPSTMSLVRAAEERRIPWIRLNDQSLIQFGHGRFQQRIQATVTSRTPHIAVELASDKEETNRLLANLGLPVPRQRLVQSAEDAVSAAERVGYPVVVKPFNANHGRGISIHLSSPEQVMTAFGVAREHSRSVIVESFITGDDHRMLVINGELVMGTSSQTVSGVLYNGPEFTVFRWNVYSRTAGTFTTRISDVDDLVREELGSKHDPNLRYFDTSIRIPQQIVYEPTATLALSSTTALSNDNLLTSFVVITSSGGPILMTALPALSTSTFSEGTVFMIQSATNTVTFQDNGTLAGSLLELGSTTRALGVGDILTLIYRNGSWWEMGFYNN